MKNLIIPKDYKSLLNIKQTENAIKLIKDTFQQQFSSTLSLRRVTAPLFVKKGMGINDELNGVERPVVFPIKDMGDEYAEIVHSLAKWKRMTLAKIDISPGYGIYTDMNAIRPDEELSNIHSLYVDQWDWERVMKEDERNLEFLKKIVIKIFDAMKRTEFVVCENYPQLIPQLPARIEFIHSEDLAKEYPEMTSSERETTVAKKYGAVFIIGIGGKMPNGEIHDGRAPDYDDWTTPTNKGYHGLNGDIILWNETLNRAFEISSMGIRVDKNILLKQLEIRNMMDKTALAWHKMLLNDEMPQSIGGGIGQSRLCMYFLRKAHIGEIQSSIWSDEMIDICNKSGINLL